MQRYTPASPYLRRFDLPVNEDTILTIRSFEKQDMRTKRGRRVRRVVLYFDERKECLALNMPNGRTLCNLFGDEMDSWIGKKIVLFRDPGVQMYGLPVSGIRVRPRVITDGTYEQLEEKLKKVRAKSRPRSRLGFNAFLALLCKLPTEGNWSEAESLTFHLLLEKLLLGQGRLAELVRKDIGEADIIIGVVDSQETIVYGQSLADLIALGYEQPKAMKVLRLPVAQLDRLVAAVRAIKDS